MYRIGFTATLKIIIALGTRRKQINNKYYNYNSFSFNI